MPLFPTEAWFEDVRAVFNGDETYRGAGGGRCSCRSAMKIGARNFLVVFEGLECAETREVDSGELESCDFYLEMPADDWVEMVRHHLQIAFHPQPFARGNVVGHKIFHHTSVNRHASRRGVVQTAGEHDR